ncbi:hypothetical protein [Methylobacterium sp. WSM2598]|uniref:hypothetical protein n=1 Tax=Methylobacterium sp. WSM2598 TaxID=398261 RepID=UPI00037F718E|nr:hypothetical protein [Methylobacterium sp. WSM2598]
MDSTRDPDPIEAREWLDPLDGLLEVEGPDRARLLIEQMIEEAREKGAPVPCSANTACLNSRSTQSICRDFCGVLKCEFF